MYEKTRTKTSFFPVTIITTRVERYLKNQLTVIVMKNIAMIDNIAINEIEKNDHIFQVQLISKHV